MIRRYAFFVALWSIFFAQASVLLAAGPSQGDAARLYHDYCSVCHGDKGDGKSRAAKSLRPPPRDFTSPRAAVELTHQRMIHSIREGRRGTSMVPWKHQLSNPQIKVLAEFIRKRFMAPTAFDTSNEGRRIYAK